MRKVLSTRAMSWRHAAIASLLCMALGSEAQGVSKQKTYNDGTRVMTTTEVRFAKAGGLFSHSQHMAMSHITFGEDGSSTYAVVMPLNTDHRLTIPVGSRMTLFMENGETMVLLNVKSIDKGDNRAEFDHTFTVRPEFAIDDSQLNVLKELQVKGIRIEADAEFIDIQREKYHREWMFNRMLQRCHDVLKWKLTERK